MALSTLRYFPRPLAALSRPTFGFKCYAAPMATTAHEEMKKFWAKNQKLNRPSSPWIIYWPHLPMMTSLTHRTTGIIMGVGLYGISTALLLAPGDFPSWIEAAKSWHVAAPVWFLAKGLMAFPLLYHYINGIRHLTWDSGHGFEVKTQYKSGYAIVGSSIALSVLVASVAYF